LTANQARAATKPTASREKEAKNSEQKNIVTTFDKVQTNSTLTGQQLK
jgi:hypothetical protein